MVASLCVAGNHPVTEQAPQECSSRTVRSNEVDAKSLQHEPQLHSWTRHAAELGLRLRSRWPPVQMQGCRCLRQPKFQIRPKANLRLAEQLSVDVQSVLSWSSCWLQHLHSKSVRRSDFLCTAVSRSLLANDPLQDWSAASATDSSHVQGRS